MHVLSADHVITEENIWVETLKVAGDAPRGGINAITTV